MAKFDAEWVKHHWKNYLGHFIGGGVLASAHLIIKVLNAEILYFLASIWVISAILAAFYQNKNHRLKILESRKMKHNFYNIVTDTLNLITNILHDRVVINYDFNIKLQKLLEGELDNQKFIDLITEQNKEKREQVNRIFARICEIYHADDFLKPENPESQSNDKFKVSYYKISKNDKQEEVLIPMYRCYPQESWPETPSIPKGSSGGGSGLAWEKKKIITFEFGGEDPRFVNFRDEQKKEYASMFCYPIKEDIPKYEHDLIIGILTVDSRKRRGFFAEKYNDFWADLTNPISKFLVLINQMDKQRDLLIKTLKIKKQDKN